MVAIEHIHPHARLSSGIEHHIQKAPSFRQNTSVVAAGKTGLMVSEIEAVEKMKPRLIRHHQHVGRNTRGQMLPIPFNAGDIRGENVINRLGHLDEVFKKSTVVLVPEHRWHTA